MPQGSWPHVAPDLLAHKGAAAFGVTQRLGVPVSCLLCPGQVQEAGGGAGGGRHVGRHLVQGTGTGPLSTFAFFLPLMNLLQLFAGPQTCVRVPLNVLESRAVATNLSCDRALEASLCGEAGQANAAAAFSCQPLLVSPASPGNAGPPLLSAAPVALVFSLCREQTTIPKG